LVTGAIGTDNRFLLQKYFLQILAGVSNADVVLDPDGALTPGAVHRIPFQLTEADAGVDVIVLSPYVKAVDFRLQTPNGLILEPWRALSEPAMRYVLGNNVSYYRLVLPTQLIAGRFDQGGTWHALLAIGHPRVTPSRDNEQGIDARIVRGLHATDVHRLRTPQVAGVSTEQQRRFAVAQSATMAATAQRTLPYSLIVHSYSSVTLRAELRQSGHEPGATVTVQARLTQSGLPLQGPAVVWGDVTRPDRSQVTVPFTSSEPGRYAAQFVADTTGVHAIRVRARGRTRKGLPFVREQTLTAVAWRGGDRDADTAAGGGDRWVQVLNERDERLCQVLTCVFGRGGAIGPEVERTLRESGLDLDRVRKCLEGHCAHRATQRSGQQG
jgi:hypothetical protein